MDEKTFKARTKKWVTDEILAMTVASLKTLRNRKSEIQNRKS